MGNVHPGIHPGALRAIREKSGLSKRQLAARMGMNHGNYIRIESGSVNSRPETLALIALHLGVRVEDFTYPRVDCPHCPERAAS
jgi:transcriptional regulator with XRE-family HTH domain